MVFLLESIYFHLFIIEMNTITINKKKESCKYVVNIYIKKILFHADAATGELALWSHRSITLAGLNKVVWVFFCFFFFFLCVLVFFVLLFYDPWSLVSNVILYSAVDECT